MMKVVGIDPGLAETGIGIVVGRGLKIDSYSFGIIKTAKNLPIQERLLRIFSKIRQLLSEQQPDLIVIEDVFSLGKNPQPGITLGKVAGVVLLAACQTDVPAVEVPVRQAKQVLTGNGNASKEQLEVAVRRLIAHPDSIKPFHLSDALALAIIGLFRNQNAPFQ
ncbi:MAG: crossover junction endodeoxyribonuclease RuvC [Desulfobacterales bacterium]|nr:crossover junction endodeoxyribonuclease RuvC [Desulfobacterales bacterium]MDJ0914902.1 crossover junction endodeoxyribonuclease RuvC [Desulfobacterales bacterium]